MWRFLAWALRLSHAHKATHGYARQSCTGMLHKALGYGPTTPHDRRETFEKHAFFPARAFFFTSNELNSTQFYWLN